MLFPLPAFDARPVRYQQNDPSTAIRRPPGKKPETYRQFPRFPIASTVCLPRKADGAPCGVQVLSQGRDLGVVRGLPDESVLKMNAFS
jgi:hypothetical protein